MIKVGILTVSDSCFRGEREDKSGKIIKGIDVEQAREMILREVKLLDTEKRNILDSLGLVLAEDVVSTSDVPPFDNSAMDGYAVIAADTVGASEASPVRLDVVEDLPAGFVSKKVLNRGQAIRIMTGASLPAGADAVVMVEFTRPLDGIIEVYREVKPRENVRDHGEDVKKGEMVLKKGSEIRPQEIGMLAALGKGEVKVVRQAKVGILATGDELVEIGEEVKPGKIRNSNSYTLYALVQRCGALPINLGTAKDDPADIEAKVRKCLDRRDLLLISGGVSVGKYDLVKDILEKLGMKTLFWKVAMKPGKPMLFGILTGKPIFGLPGNPVSNFVCFEEFVRPALLRMMGKSSFTGPEIHAILTEEIKEKPGKTRFLRARVEKRGPEYYVRTTGPQGSGILKSLILANGLIVIPKEVGSLKTGERVRVRLFNSSNVEE